MTNNNGWLTERADRQDEEDMEDEYYRINPPVEHTKESILLLQQQWVKACASAQAAYTAVETAGKAYHRALKDQKRLSDAVKRSLTSS